MTPQAMFDNRSGRVIALFRAVLALVFLVALLIEPVSVTSSLNNGQILLSGYFMLSLILIPVAWRSWWYDQRLAPAMLVVDVAVFVSAVYLTESSNADFTSPFLAMFALAILSATLRWDWRVAVRTGVVTTLIFIVAGMVVWWLGLPVDGYRYSRRAFYMLALLLVLVWFGVQRRDPHIPPMAPQRDDRGDEPLHGQVLAYAMAVAGARTGAIAWTDAEEPWIDIEANLPAPDQHRSERLGPDMLPGWDEARAEVRLFDVIRRRKLVRDADNRPQAMPLSTRIALAERTGIPDGLCLPVDCISGSGLIVLGGISGAGADFVTLGRILAREIASGIDRVSVQRLERGALLARTRSAIARDLHDSVAQSLAGACFRLEALRRAMAENPAAQTELLTIRDALRREQGHVRALIDTLRNPAQLPQPHDLGADLAATLNDAAAHWAIAASMAPASPIEASGWLSHELQQLVREAVANAARHGRARTVTARVSVAGNRIALDIADDGCGFDVATRPDQPWSIRERVAALGGELAVDSNPAGTQLSLTVPMGLAGSNP